MIRKVLFVDDDQILRAAIEQRLGRHKEQFQLVTAADGIDAVVKLKQHPVSLVVVDLIMPRMDGMSLISHLRQYYPDLPIVIASGVGDDKVAEAARNSEAYDYLNKPFQGDDLVALIKEVLDWEAEGGTMKEVSPPVFMQLMEMDARTCTVRILDNFSGQGGVLHFNQGELYDARVGEESGLEAAHKIFSWDRTTIFMRYDCAKTENRINASLGSIIMEALGMKDETEERPDDYDEKENIASFSDSNDYSETVAWSLDGGEGRGQRILLTIEALEKELKNIEGFETIRGDVLMQKVVDKLTIMGNASGYGNLVAATIEEGRSSSRILVPTQPAAFIEAESRAASRIEIAVQQKLQGH